ncbi:hypothetical protein Pcinc_037249 [Petrolisthes cinctipes]|uniref:Uncharacterized protein n=1 Tax=Petrolisthes cinctipes TaxID=88211 RepID=A0AAE1BW21_PETCI|nr:hypothetical protein Pcinc_037249 [Petrolisthes cinctipes]
MSRRCRRGGYHGRDDRSEERNGIPSPDDNTNNTTQFSKKTTITMYCMLYDIPFAQDNQDKVQAHVWNFTK